MHTRSRALPSRGGRHPQAYWKHGRQLYDGIVTAINRGDGTVSIEYHDGDAEAGVPTADVRPGWNPMGRAAKSAATKIIAEQAVTPRTRNTRGGEAMVALSPRRLEGPGLRRTPSRGRQSSKSFKSPRVSTPKQTALHGAMVSPSACKRICFRRASDGFARALVVGTIAETARAAPPRAGVKRAGPPSTKVGQKVEGVLQEFASVDCTQVAGYLFRNLSTADTAVFNRLDTAQTALRELKVELDARATSHTALARTSAALFAPPRKHPGDPRGSIDIGATAAKRADSLQQALACVLGTSASALCGPGLSAQLTGMSHAIDVAVGVQ